MEDWQKNEYEHVVFLRAKDANLDGSCSWSSTRQKANDLPARSGGRVLLSGDGKIEEASSEIVP